MLRVSYFLQYLLPLAFFLSFGVLPSSYAEDKQERKIETASDLYRHVVEKTFTGNVFHGQENVNNFKEYHSPDGRVLGYNWDTDNNINSCWRIANKNTLCYYYPDKGGEACWVVDYRNNKSIYGTLTRSPGVTMKADIEYGNPDSITDYGVKWTCGEQIVALNAK